MNTADFSSARMISFWQSSTILAGQDVGPVPMIARPGIPTDPKSHLFATKWVAMPPFVDDSGHWDRGSAQNFGAEVTKAFPPPSIGIFVSIILDQKYK